MQPMPHIELVDRTATVSSLQIAEHFDKLHKNVLRDIEELIAELPADFHRLNFEPMSHDVPIGNGAIRKDQSYRLSRDAFTLLAMGFTGPKALRWKLAYIQAFNRMEHQLMARAIFDGYQPETRHDAVSFLRLLLVAEKSYDGAALLSYLLTATAAGDTNDGGYVTDRGSALADRLAIEPSTLKYQIDRFARWGLIEIGPTAGRHRAIRLKTAALHERLTSIDPAIVDQFVQPRVGLTLQLARAAGFVQ